MVGRVCSRDDNDVNIASKSETSGRVFGVESVANPDPNAVGVLQMRANTWKRDPA